MVPLDLQSRYLFRAPAPAARRRASDSLLEFSANFPRKTKFAFIFEQPNPRHACILQAAESLRFRLAFGRKNRFRRSHFKKLTGSPEKPPSPSEGIEGSAGQGDATGKSELPAAQPQKGAVATSVTPLGFPQYHSGFGKQVAPLPQNRDLGPLRNSVARNFTAMLYGRADRFESQGPKLESAS